MTAAAADRNEVQFKGRNADLRSYLVADNVKIYKNTIVVLDSGGYLRPARGTAGELVAGIAVEQVDNTLSGHAAGGKSCRVTSNLHVLLLCAATAAQTSVGATFYATDDLTTTATAGTPVGVVSEYVDATHVWIFIPTLAPTNAAGVLATTGDVKVTAGNLRLGAISTFGTTEPTLAVVMKAGTAPAGAITTSGGLFASATVVRKIIADGTVSNVET